jgi:hypothetical protein
MAEAAPGEPCDLCCGTGVWSGGCDVPDDCWQCHGMGVQRVRGNCESCLGWGWSFGPHKCEVCAETGWVAADVALFRCGECKRVFNAPAQTAECSRCLAATLTRLSGTR